ncbi:hypothetical protein DDZ14_15365 [Maritimibacter sp. 55A14]|uniref:hypothetical protein n=1 Tax=Maritimibacter sp. 55A14 TaxID=2174844 RepID=UPI000D61465C|nr:hypothetical protein [Maritimibacter sp. 55A14]PWE30531.1 hypothetical protein DDZ14_15365 [Maritimibacter sp. 55A14]
MTEIRQAGIGPLAALLLILSAGFLWAQKAQDWIPAEISLPEDMEVLTDRAIGSSARIFSFATGQDVGALLEGWRTALMGAGYEVKNQPEAVEMQQIEFSGPGIGNAKISVSPSPEDERSVLQFDASLK